MIVYQIQARGFVDCLGGSPHAIVSKEIYTSQPGDREKEEFKRKCSNGDRIRNLDPEWITISVIQYELIDNGGVLSKVKS